MNAPSRLSEEVGDHDDFGGTGNQSGLGIRVSPQPKSQALLWHGGSLPGTSTLAMRTPDGFAWVVTVNSRPKDWQRFRAEVERGRRDLHRKTWKWPDGDLFAAR